MNFNVAPAEKEKKKKRKKTLQGPDAGSYWLIGIFQLSQEWAGSPDIL